MPQRFTPRGGITNPQETGRRPLPQPTGRGGRPADSTVRQFDPRLNPRTGDEQFGRGGGGIRALLEAQPKSSLREDLFRDPRLEENRRRLEEEIARARGRGPTQLNQQQQAFIQQLQAQARGQGPSIAQQQLRSATDRNLSQQLAAQAAGGGNPALAQRQAALQGGAAAAGLAQQSGIQRLQEQQGAQQLLGGQLGQAQSFELQAQAQQDALVQNFLNAGLTLDQAQFAANQELARLQTERDLGFAGLKSQEDIAQIQADVARRGQDQQLIGSFIGAGGAGIAAMFSDRRLKKDIKRSKEDLDEFMDALRSYRFKYKNQSHGKGEHAGVMAQDVEKSSVGKDMVLETPVGKALDMRKGFSALMAGQARLNERLRELEGK